MVPSYVVRGTTSLKPPPPLQPFIMSITSRLMHYDNNLEDCVFGFQLSDTSTAALNISHRRGDRISDYG